MISLCIISREEDQESLYPAIGSVSNYVDEVIVVDTSKNGSIVIRSTKNLHLDKILRFVPFKWTGSFADARNFSFEQATGDIIFTIDSDDIVKNPENLLKQAKLIEDGIVDWIYMEYIYQKDEFGNVLAKHWKPRLFRKGTGHWVGDVHEDFMPDQVVVQRKDEDLGKDRVIIEHTATADELLAHSQRNLEIQLAEIERDGDKVDPRTIQYTAMSYQGLGEYSRALPYFLKHAQVTGSKEDKFWSFYRASLCFFFLRKNEEALNMALESLKLFPQWQSSYLMLATIYNEMEDWQKVIEWTVTGLEKEYPDTLQVVSDLDYTILPLSRLVIAYLQTGSYELANSTAIQVYQMNPAYPGSKDLVKSCMEALKLEGFVKSFIEVVQNIKKYDRVKATQLFDLVPKELDEDYRIQAARNMIVAPKKWPEKSVVIYCGRSLEEWSYPSIFQGIGGSEEAVINMSEQFAKQGYSVTVYNRCGDMKGTYNEYKYTDKSHNPDGRFNPVGKEYRGSVTYLPYYYFNKKDTFDTLIIWRNPLAFDDTFNAKHKYLWLHDIAHPEHFNEKIYGNIDKILFLSNWHATNLPDCPPEKVFITNNGINPDDFKDLPPKKPNSLFWGSSYDRGLLPFIKNILPLIKKEIPDVTLDVAYGWANVEKEMELIPSLKDLYTELSPILENTPGITHHGRLSHKKLAQLMGECMVYPYASEFGETNNITSQKCQAAECVVVTTQQAGGTPERVELGFVVPYDNIYSDKKAQKEFAEVVIKYLKRGMMSTGTTSIKKRFSWSTTANQWIKSLL